MLHRAASERGISETFYLEMSNAWQIPAQKVNVQGNDSGDDHWRIG
jgi:hypothetical protein